MGDWDARRQDSIREGHEGFQRAAHVLIPQICQRPKGQLCNNVELTGLFGYVEAVWGLLHDMYRTATMHGFNKEERVGLQFCCSHRQGWWRCH